MPGDRHFRRIDTIQLKLQIEMMLGRQKADQYFNLLKRYFSLKISKSDFDRHCIGLLGRESVTLHNGLIRAIIRNAHVSKSSPPKHEKGKASLNVKVPNKYQKSSHQWPRRDSIPQSPRSKRSPTIWDRNSKGQSSPLGPHGKPKNVACEDSIPKNQEQQSAPELLPLGSKPPVEVNPAEEGEKIEQHAKSPRIHSRSPLRAPFGVTLNAKGERERAFNGSPSHFVDVETCYRNGELLDSGSLRKRLEQKLEMQGLSMSMDCVNLLNNGLDAFMKRLLKPCVDLASSRSESKVPNKFYQESTSFMNKLRPLTYLQNSNRPFSVSMMDFQVAMVSNPQILGEDRPVQMEKVVLCASEEHSNT